MSDNDLIVSDPNQFANLSLSEDEINTLLDPDAPVANPTSFSNLPTGELQPVPEVAEEVNLVLPEENTPLENQEIAEEVNLGPPEEEYNAYSPDRFNSPPQYQEYDPFEQDQVPNDEEVFREVTPGPEDRGHQSRIQFFTRHRVEEEIERPETNDIDSLVEAEKELASLFKFSSQAGGLGNLVPKRGRNPASPRSRKRRDQYGSRGNTAFKEVEDETVDRKGSKRQDKELALKERVKPLKYKTVAMFIRKCLKDVVSQLDFTDVKPLDFRTNEIADLVLLRIDFYLSYYLWFVEDSPTVQFADNDQFRADQVRYLAKTLIGENSDPRRAAARSTVGKIAGLFWVPHIKNVETLHRGSRRPYPLQILVEDQIEVPFETDEILKKFSHALGKFLSIAPINPRLEEGELVYEFPKLTRGKYGKRTRVTIEGFGTRLSPKGADEDGRRCDEGTNIYSDLCLTEKALKRIDRARQMTAVAGGFIRKARMTNEDYSKRIRGFEYYAGLDTINKIHEGLSKKNPKITKLPTLQGDDDPMTAPDLNQYDRSRDQTNAHVQNVTDTTKYVKVAGSGSSVKRNAASEFLDAYRLVRQFEFFPKPPLSFVDTDTGKTMNPDDALYTISRDDVINNALENGADPNLLLSVIPNPCRVCEEQSYSYLVGTRRGAPNRLALGEYARLIWFSHFILILTLPRLLNSTTITKTFMKKSRTKTLKKVRPSWNCWLNPKTTTSFLIRKIIKPYK